MTAVTTAPRAARPVGQEWDRLASATRNPGIFDASTIGDLPDPDDHGPGTGLRGQPGRRAAGQGDVPRVGRGCALRAGRGAAP